LSGVIAFLPFLLITMPGRVKASETEKIEAAAAPRALPSNRNGSGKKEALPVRMKFSS